MKNNPKTFTVNVQYKAVLELKVPAATLEEAIAKTRENLNENCVIDLGYTVADQVQTIVGASAEWGIYE